MRPFSFSSIHALVTHFTRLLSYSPEGPLTRRGPREDYDGPGARETLLAAGPGEAGPRSPGPESVSFGEAAWRQCPQRVEVH